MSNEGGPKKPGKSKPKDKEHNEKINNAPVDKEEFLALLDAYKRCLKKEQEKMAQEGGMERAEV